MKKYPDTQTLEVITHFAKAMGANVADFHFCPQRVCDNCKDESKEAFIYCVTDRNGKYWTDLCNDCFDTLGCKYDEWNEDSLPCVS